MENTGRFIKLFGFTLDREGSGSLEVKHEGYYIKIIHPQLSRPDIESGLIDPFGLLFILGGFDSTFNVSGSIIFQNILIKMISCVKIP